MRHLTSSVIGLTILSAAATASATPKIVDSSGKGGVGTTCHGCHGRKTPEPTIDVDLPATMTAGETRELTLTVKGTLAYTSFDAEFDNGFVVTAGQNTGVPNPNIAPFEVIAKDKLSGATGTYKFTVKAPNRNGAMKLWVAAVSANGDEKRTGDLVGTLVKTVTVTGAPDAGAGDDAGTSSSSSSSSGSVPADAGTPKPTDAGATRTAPSSSGNAAPANDDDGGCQSSPRGPVDLAWLAGAGLAVLALRRKRH